MGIKNLFADYKYTKIALYGLGTETEKVLKEFAKDYEIVGLLDGFQENGELYGKSIISLDDAIKKEVNSYREHPLQKFHFFCKYLRFFLQSLCRNLDAPPQ